MMGEICNMLVLAVIFITWGGSNTVRSQGVAGFGVYKDCGGVIPMSALYTTQISYKFGEVFNSFEFCVWTILPDANILGFGLQLAQNFTDERDGLRAYVWDEELTSIKIPNNSTYTFFEKSPLYLAFSSNGSNEGTGFSARITNITVNRNNIGGSKVRGYHIEKDEGEWSYKSDQADYTSIKPISIIVQAGKNNSGPVMKIIRIDNIEMDPESGVKAYSIRPYFHDYLPIYVRSRVFGTGSDEFPVDAYYPTAFLFSSNRQAQNRRFNISWSNFVSKNIDRIQIENVGRTGRLEKPDATRSLIYSLDI